MCVFIGWLAFSIYDFNKKGSDDQKSHHKEVRIKTGGGKSKVIMCFVPALKLWIYEYQKYQSIITIYHSLNQVINCKRNRSLGH